MADEEKKEFWITNVTDSRVTLGDLYYSVPPRRTVNLLSSHFRFTLEQLEKSKESGSLFTKKDKIKVRLFAPPEPKKQVLRESKELIIRVANRTKVKVETKKYEELSVSDGDDLLEASEFSDTIEDEIPAFLKKKR